MTKSRISEWEVQVTVEYLKVLHLHSCEQHPPPLFKKFEGPPNEGILSPRILSYGYTISHLGYDSDLPALESSLGYFSLMPE